MGGCDIIILFVHIINFAGMFADATGFTGKGLTAWDVASVTDFRWMFKYVLYTVYI